MKLVKDLKELSKSDTSIAGGKGASLGEMIQAGIQVPSGFVILSNAFDRFIEETDLNIEIDAALDKADIKRVHTIENASEKIQSMILSEEMPKDIKKEILKSHKKMDSTFVAVRSSATSEDSASAAWAGQLDSYLNTTEETLLDNVKKCWASLFTPRAIFYRFEQKLNKTKISVAVVVQKMVDSEESGIAFSVHPVTQDENQIIIEAGFGLGEAIVSGSITPDSYVVDKQGFKILDINVNEQTKALYKKAKGGNEWKELEEKGKDQVLSKKEIIELSRLIVKIEDHYGFPCDIEWAEEKGRFYIVQSRPITTLIKEKIKRKRTLLEQFYSLVPKTDEFHFQAPISGLLSTIPWSDKQIYKEYYDTPPMPLFLVAKERDAIYAVSNRLYKQYAKEIFQRFVDKKIDIPTLKGWFDGLKLKVDKLYRKEIKNPRKIAKEITFLFAKFLTVTVYSETFDRDVIESVLNLKIKDKEWKTATTLTFESFEQRWNKALCNAKSIEEIEYIFCDYYFPKSKEFIMGEMDKCKAINLNRTVINKNKKRTKKSDKDWIRFTRFVMYLRDIRKDSIAKSQIILVRCARKLFPSLEDRYLPFICPLELTQDELPSDEEIMARKNGYLILIKPDRTYQIRTEEYEKSREILEKGDLEGTKVIRGSSANKGQGVGRVKIIIDPSKSKDFNEGDILVTSMTRTYFIPLMKKAGAIVTNEGGITCHAAIISRELGIPCIIGTKNATRVLKDGDLVEVDANKGVVRILKKANKK